MLTSSSSSFRRIDKDGEMYLGRPGRRKATFPEFYGSWSFITAFTSAHHLSLPKPNQFIPLPFTILRGAAVFLPGRAKDLSAPRYLSLYLSFNNVLQNVVPTPVVTNPVSILYIFCMQDIQVINNYNLKTQ